MSLSGVRRRIVLAEQSEVNSAAGVGFAGLSVFSNVGQRSRKLGQQIAAEFCRQRIARLVGGHVYWIDGGFAGGQKSLTGCAAVQVLLTAAAVDVGAGVILFDALFQGVAILLMAGEVASTLLSRMAVPVRYLHE
jgi:hypothetical protein